MPLLTENGDPLLMESGAALLSEDETGEPGVVAMKGRATLQLAAQGALSGTSNVVSLQGQAALRLNAQGALSGIGNPVSLQGRATLRLVSSGKISKPNTLQGRASLKLIYRNGVITTPTGLAALMRVISDSVRPEVVLDQYLMVWFNGHPSQCQMTLQIDEGATFSPVSTWMNPGTTGPAILKIDSAEIPGDGSTHKITINVRVNSAGRTGPWASTAIYAKTPKPRTVDQPEWCEAVLLRQGGIGANAPLTDLTRIRWRHPGAVKIMARIPVRTADLMAWTTREIALGYADYDESEFIAEGVGRRLEYFGGYERNVEFGVCAIDRGNFGPVLWASSPVSIREISTQDVEPTVLNPDQRAGTVRAWRYVDFKAAVTSAVQAQATSWPGNGSFITATALDQTLLAIKDIVRKGGDVTLDHLCRFEARWNPDRTIRNVGCSLSAGFKEGTRQGRIMTDEEAKAA